MATAAKPAKAGDRITWTHYSTPGAGWQPPAERSGTVWSEAPKGNGLSNAWWIHPDVPQPGEILASGVLCVGRAAATHHYNGTPVKGEIYSSSFHVHAAADRTLTAYWALRRPEVALAA